MLTAQGQLKKNACISFLSLMFFSTASISSYGVCALNTAQSPKVLLNAEDLTQAQHVTDFDGYDKSKAFIIARHLGAKALWSKQIPSNVKAEMIKRTLWDAPPVQGFAPPIAPGSTMIMPSYLQHRGDEIGFFLSLSDLQKDGLYTPVRGGGPHMTVGKDMTAFPWPNSGSQLEMETEAGVSYVRTSTTGTLRPFEQLSFIFYLKDTSTNQSIAFVFNFFDPRGVYSPSVQNDTNVDFVSSPLAENGSSFLTLAPDSAKFQSTQGPRKKFHFLMDEVNLLNSIRALNSKATLTKKKLSLDPKVYMLTTANVFFELPNYVPDVTTNAGASIKGFKVQISNK